MPFFLPGNPDAEPASPRNDDPHVFREPRPIGNPQQEVDVWIFYDSTPLVTSKRTINAPLVPVEHPLIIAHWRAFFYQPIMPQFFVIRFQLPSSRCGPSFLSPPTSTHFAPRPNFVIFSNRLPFWFSHFLTSAPCATAY